ncbi:putative pectate lyase 12 [Vitis vinifera]|uniref:Pectate lyase n=1 Tax=Vitis vinifera TaxID=29760 RepID=A0A438EK06_VITVI|nr:putative pectate lyase 12 [Vitis vinifera]
MLDVDHSRRKPTQTHPSASAMLRRTCIVLISLLSSLSALATPMQNLTLLGQHPDPEAVVQEVQRRVNVSVSRRQTLEVSQSDQSSCVTGNPIDDCWRCDPNWEADRQRLADCAIGFGQYALGGKGGQIYVVTDSSDHDAVTPRPGTLRYAVIQSDPPGSSLHQHAHQTLPGAHLQQLQNPRRRGANVHIVGGGCITLQYISNVIIHNIHIHHCVQSGEANVRSSPTHYGWRTLSDGDGISIFGSRDIWIDHCSLSHCKDGLIDAVMGSTGITISNNFFSHHDEVMLLGHSDSGCLGADAAIYTWSTMILLVGRCMLLGVAVAPPSTARESLYAPSNRNAKEVTKRVDTDEKKWRDWNWRSEGDILVNGAFFIASGETVEVLYEKAYSVEPKSAALIDQLTINAGVLGGSGNNLGTWRTERSGGGYGFGDDYSENMLSGSPSSFALSSTLLPPLFLLSSFLLLYL